MRYDRKRAERYNAATDTFLARAAAAGGDAEASRLPDAPVPAPVHVYASAAPTAFAAIRELAATYAARRDAYRTAVASAPDTAARRRIVLLADIEFAAWQRAKTAHAMSVAAKVGDRRVLDALTRKRSQWDRAVTSLSADYAARLRADGRIDPDHVARADGARRAAAAYAAMGSGGYPPVVETGSHLAAYAGLARRYRERMVVLGGEVSGLMATATTSSDYVAARLKAEEIGRLAAMSASVSDRHREWAQKHRSVLASLGAAPSDRSARKIYSDMGGALPPVPTPSDAISAAFVSGCAAAGIPLSQFAKEATGTVVPVAETPGLAAAYAVAAAAGVPSSTTARIGALAAEMARQGYRDDIAISFFTAKLGADDARRPAVISVVTEATKAAREPSYGDVSSAADVAAEDAVLHVLAAAAEIVRSRLDARRPDVTAREGEARKSVEAEAEALVAAVAGEDSIGHLTPQRSATLAAYMRGDAPVKSFDGKMLSPRFHEGLGGGADGMSSDALLSGAATGGRDNASTAVSETEAETMVVDRLARNASIAAERESAILTGSGGDDLIAARLELVRAAHLRARMEIVEVVAALKGDMPSAERARAISELAEADKLDALHALASLGHDTEAVMSSWIRAFGGGVEVDAARPEHLAVAEPYAPGSRGDAPYGFGGAVKAEATDVAVIWASLSPSELERYRRSSRVADFVGLDVVPDLHAAAELVAVMDRLADADMPVYDIAQALCEAFGVAEHARRTLTDTAVSFLTAIPADAAPLAPPPDDLSIPTSRDL